MGFRIIELKLPTGYSENELKERIAKECRSRKFTWQIETKSLDARKKGSIHWLLRVGVSSQEIKGEEPEPGLSLEIPYLRKNKRVVITGSGPAGFFAAYVLQKAGFDTLILERGAEVDKRAKGIADFEHTGEFSPVANYSFGEGGAGTFSDGKLTSRSKHISPERDFFLSEYIRAGAPEEIRYMTHPHVGSDNLKRIVKNLRKAYTEMGGEIRFEKTVLGITVKDGKMMEAVTEEEPFPADYFIFAPGHSSYETYRMLIAAGVQFRTKGFALGCRAEHLQSDINRAQWGVEGLPGVKAAEYRLASDGDGKHPVYSFCMCPGGIVVPAATYRHINIVNGMSFYGRGGEFSNAACVAGIHPDELTGRKATPLEALEWLENLEATFFDYSGSYRAPFCSISDFLHESEPHKVPETSYPLGLVPAPLWNMIPKGVADSLKSGLADFCRKIKGYEKGTLLGLESKTSSPVQVIREKNGLCTGFDNLFLAGEGSGYAGGIVSSAADGIKIAMNIIGSCG
ncbi:MAG: FAD-dependent monooxygenase [Bacteroidetes bacterium]|nr:FAD-dependent monooxygenase [Bacteroidota bacterium]